MPNTKADLARLRLAWIEGDGDLCDTGDEILALCERLLVERDRLRESLAEPRRLREGVERVVKTLVRRCTPGSRFHVAPLRSLLKGGDDA